MNNVYEFRSPDTYLVVDDDALLGSGKPDDADPRTTSVHTARFYVVQTRTSQPTAHAPNAVLARCGAFVRALRKGLRVVRAMYELGDDGNDDKRAASRAEWRTRCDAAVALPDLDAAWPHTAPLAPTALLSAVFALPPLVHVAPAKTPLAATAEGASAFAAYCFYYDAPYCAVLGEPPVNAERRACVLWRTRYSTWHGFLSTLNCVLHDCTPDEQSHFTLQGYLARVTGANDASNRVAESSVLVWGEDLLWRLLNALLSSLALLHSVGLTLHGKVCAEDVICVAVPAQASAQLQDTALSVSRSSSTTGEAQGGERSCANAGTAADRVRRYMHASAQCVVLPNALVTERTPCHRAFFVLTRLPALLLDDAWDDLDTERAVRDGTIDGCVDADMRVDVAAVGRLMRDVIAVHERRREAAGSPLSSELLFLIERMTAATDGAARTPSSLSSLQLVQLQAVRLRVSKWVYQTIAEDRHLRTRFWCDGGGTGPSETAVEAALHERAARLATREAKLDVFLELYELTHEQLDRLPRLSPAQVDEGKAWLRSQCVTQRCGPTPRDAAVRPERRGPLLSPCVRGEDEVCAATSLHAVTRDDTHTQPSSAATDSGVVEIDLSAGSDETGRRCCTPRARTFAHGERVRRGAAAGDEGSARRPTRTRARTDDGWFSDQLRALEEMHTRFARSAVRPDGGDARGAVRSGRRLSSRRAASCRARSGDAAVTRELLLRLRGSAARTH